MGGPSLDMADGKWRSTEWAIAYEWNEMNINTSCD